MVARKFRKAWPQELLDALGTTTDAELAVRFGCRVGNVQGLRERLGIPSWRQREQTMARIGKRRGRPKSTAMENLRMQGLSGPIRRMASPAEERTCQEITETFGFSQHTLDALRTFRRDHGADPVDPA